MKEFIKKNINIILAIFILIQPLLDLFTGLCIHTFNINVTVGIYVRMLFLIFMMVTTLFIFKKYKLLIPYSMIAIYSVLYLIGIIVYKDTSIFSEMQGLVKVFYFPILFVSLYAIKDEIKISKMTLFVSLYIYLIFIFVPTILGVGYKTYEITKSGTLGFFNSANEISGIISILTPIMFIVILHSKNIIPKLILAVTYFTVILMMGTKTPLLTLGITVGFSMIYFWIELIKKKKYIKVGISVIVIIVAMELLLLILPRTNFFKNIETHLSYLKLESVTEIFKEKKLVDHFIFSQRLTFLDKKAKIYHNASNYQKLFGVGYINKNNKPMKLIEMDFFDVFYNHGIVGFIVFFSIMLYVISQIIKKDIEFSFENFMEYISAILVLFLSFITGHILTAPSVSIVAIVLLLALIKKDKKDLLFASYSMDIGGIEKALLNLVNRVDLSKYNVTIILEEKRGIFLNKINKNITIKELKVSNNSNVVLRKIINATRKLLFKIFYYNNYDFSCCYATYSYSSSKIALMASTNTAFYVHNDYRTIYKEDNDFYKFFDSRNIKDYKNIIFVSNENKEGFLKKYPTLKTKCKVFNNFINTSEIIRQSEEKIDKKKSDKKTFVYIGRLDDAAKKISRQINLVKEIKDIELWIIGDGPDREKYEKEVKEFKLENRVKFFGKKANPFPYFKAADYIILTSDYEGFPVTYLEAITLHKKIITTFPTSDDSIDINKYAYVISKDKEKMVKEVKNILREDKEIKEIDLDSIQESRMVKLERMFDNTYLY